MNKVTYIGNDLAANEQGVTFPVLPGHNWTEGQQYEEGRDYITKQEVGLEDGIWVYAENEATYDKPQIYNRHTALPFLQPMVNNEIN